jgi:hypothetical protein
MKKKENWWFFRGMLDSIIKQEDASFVTSIVAAVAASTVLRTHFGRQ